MLASVVALYRGGQFLEQPSHAFLCGDTWRQHRQEAVRAVQCPHTSDALQCLSRHAEQRFPDEDAIAVGTCTGSEPDYIKKKDGTVFPVQHFKAMRWTLGCTVTAGLFGGGNGMGKPYAEMSLVYSVAVILRGFFGEPVMNLVLQDIQHARVIPDEADEILAGPHKRPNHVKCGYSGRSH